MVFLSFDGSFSKTLKKHPLSTDIIITLTIFSNEYSFIVFMATQYIDQILKKLSYSVKKVTCGKHIESSRLHYHIMFRVSTDGSRIYKDLSSKIHRISTTELTFPCKELADMYRDTDIKISTMYQGETKKYKKKIITFGEESMRYPFKEYTSFSEVDLELQSGFTEPQLKSLWEQAHQDWKNVKKQEKDALAVKIQEASEFQELNEYLLERHKTLDLELSPSSGIENLIRETMKHIWEYKHALYKLKKCKTVRVASIKDQAISWLVFNGYILSEDIVNLTY